ncbi:MAG: transcription termination/antitermination protein NusA, partial [Simkania sp.]|nr:transcription termination/antitermination protein NusA [Simkania sp.]
IGKRGMNARLNAELIGAEIEVKKMSEYQAALTFEKQQLSQDVGPELDMELEQVEGLNQFVIDSLKEAGYNTPRKILNAPIEELMKSTGISSEMAQDIIEKIQKIRT